MLVRYSKSADGKPVKQAEVYTKEEHGLKLEQIDPDALFITRKLRSAGTKPTLWAARSAISC